MALPMMFVAVVPAALYLAAAHLYHGDDLARIEALARIARRVGVDCVTVGRGAARDRLRREVPAGLVAAAGRGMCAAALCCLSATPSA